MINLKTLPAFSLLSVVTLSIGLCCFPVSAGAQAKVLTTPDVNYPIQFDISPPLRDIATQSPSQMGFHLAPPVRHPKQEQLMQAAQQGKQPAADGALQTTSAPPVNATIGLNLLGVGNGFPGYSEQV